MTMMRRNRTAIGMGLLGLAVLAGPALGAGCSNLAEDCKENYRPCEGASGTSAGGSGGGTPVGCIPSENLGGAVGNECGVFVGGPLGKDTNPGTKEAPLATLVAAVALADTGAKRVYACATDYGMYLSEVLVVPAGMTIYGALACEQNWGHLSGVPVRLTAPAGQIPLTLDGTVGSGPIRLEDVEVLAAPAEEAGGSSVAVVVNQAEVTFKNVEFTAQEGKEGAAGEEVPGTGMDGAMGEEGDLACSATPVNGGLPIINDCGTPADTSDDSLSGSGGVGQQATGTDGSPGDPGSAVNDNSGEGQSSMVGDACADGKVGNPGDPGPFGMGATMMGTVSTTGFTGNGVGASGLRGLPGQGGGGGGASKGGAPCAAGLGGASGGSGGSGGCGGVGGNGGRPGGSSIALISLRSTLTLEEDVRLRAKEPGAGGSGGLGQSGGAGAMGGVGGENAGMMTLNAGCDGGMGGMGGLGGIGGGGTGGHSIGIAYVGTPPPALPSSETTQSAIEHAEMGGAGGPGGDDASMTDDGAEGMAAAVMELPEG